ncbi:MAG TPA: hypothetical protein VGO86_19225 [Candidatus Dormibacteraeota bacterium]
MLYVVVALMIVSLVAAACQTGTARPSSSRPQPTHQATSQPAQQPGPTGPTPAAGAAAQDPATAARIRDILQTMHTHAFNPQAPAPKGSTRSGGLFINWRGTWDGDLKTASSNTNVQSSALSDSEAGSNPRHDPLTDLVYLRNLYAYRARHPDDRAYANDIARMEPIVKDEFAASTYYRCWVYFHLRDLDRTGPGQGWDAIASHFADGVYRRFYDAQAGTIVESGGGTYRTDFAAECGAMLIDAGHRQGNAAWTQAGASTLSHLLQQARNPTTHLFPLRMQLGQPRDAVVQAQLKVGEEAQLLDSYLLAYDVTSDARYLEAAIQGTQSLYDPATGLLDKTGGGFFFSIDAGGQNLQSSYKETRQAWMVPLLAHLNRVGAVGQWADLERAMAGVVRDRLWQPSIGGYPYRESPGFTLYQTSGGRGHTPVTENFASSEAMGIAYEALDAAT